MPIDSVVENPRVSDSLFGTAFVHATLVQSHGVRKILGVHVHICTPICARPKNDITFEINQNIYMILKHLPTTYAQIYLKHPPDFFIFSTPFLKIFTQIFSYYFPYST